MAGGYAALSDSELLARVPLLWERDQGQVRGTARRPSSGTRASFAASAALDWRPVGPEGRCAFWSTGACCCQLRRSVAGTGRVQRAAGAGVASEGGGHIAVSTAGVRMVLESTGMESTASEAVGNRQEPFDIESAFVADSEYDEHRYQ